MSWAVWLLIVLGALVLVLLSALASPLRLRGEVDERGLAGAVEWLGLGVDVDGRRREVDVRLFGRRLLRRPMGTEAARKEAEAPDAERAETPERGASRREKRRGGRLPLRSWRALAAAGLREARTLLRRLHVDRLRLDGVVASDDPALTGTVYGYGCALVSMIRGVWPHADLRWDADFVATRPRGRAELALRLRPIGLVGSAWRMGFAFLRERRRNRRSS